MALSLGLVGVVAQAPQPEGGEGEEDRIEVSESFAEAMERYGDLPVEATQVTGPNQFSPITLLDLTAGGVKFKYPDLESPVTIPEEELTFRIGYRPDFDTRRYGTLLREGREDEALELLREVAYPLQKFVPIDPQKAGIHAIMARLLDRLLEAGKIDEAASFLESFPRERLTGYYREQAVQAASLLVEEGQVERAYDMAKTFPIGPGETTFSEIYLRLANELRLRKEWEEARNLYKDVQLASDPSETPEAFLWEAYIYLQEDKAFMVRGILDRFSDLDEKNPYFSLRELVKGVVLSGEEKYQEALSTLAKGVVYATTNDPWTPELLYRTADLYEKEDRPGAAEEIREQLRFFYPDSIWAERLPPASG